MLHTDLLYSALCVCVFAPRMTLLRAITLLHRKKSNCRQWETPWDRKRSKEGESFRWRFARAERTGAHNGQGRERPGKGWETGCHWGEERECEVKFWCNGMVVHCRNTELPSIENDWDLLYNPTTYAYTKFQRVILDGVKDYDIQSVLIPPPSAHSGRFTLGLQNYTVMCVKGIHSILCHHAKFQTNLMSTTFRKKNQVPWVYFNFHSNNVIWSECHKLQVWKY